LNEPFDRRAGGSKSRPVTLLDIARAARVSTATVSLALRDNTSVSADTRERVKKTAQELGYIYNRSAASMRTLRSGIIGITANRFDNLFMGAFLEAVEQRISAFRSGLLIGSVREDVDIQRASLERFMQFKVDGVVVSPAAATRPADIAFLHRTGIPMVQAIREIEGADLDFVGCDNAHGTNLALSHLFELGHRRIASIGGRGESSTGVARRQAVERFFRESGLVFPPDLWHSGDMTFQHGIRAGKRLLERAERPTAVLCFNDSIAFGLASALREARLEVPRDISIVAFDDTPDAAMHYPGLTAIASHQSDIGTLAIDLLFERIADPELPTRRRIVTPSLHIRASSAPPRAD
jgi:LacI family transcriptional regulator